MSRLLAPNFTEIMRSGELKTLSDEVVMAEKNLDKDGKCRNCPRSECCSTMMSRSLTVISSSRVLTAEVRPGGTLIPIPGKMDNGAHSSHNRLQQIGRVEDRYELSLFLQNVQQPPSRVKISSGTEVPDLDIVETDAGTNVYVSVRNSGLGEVGDVKNNIVVSCTHLKRVAFEARPRLDGTLWPARKVPSKIAVRYAS